MSRDFKNVSVFEGPSYIADFKHNEYTDPIIEIKGLNGLGLDATIGFDADMLSKHLLILGGIGMGKTNLFKDIVKQASSDMKKDDVMLIFDTKGDFYNTFGDTKKDILISNTPVRNAKGVLTEPGEESTWNIFLELDSDKLYETSNEIASMIFAPHIEKSSQSFFPLAAKSIFAAVLREIYRCSGEVKGHFPNNELLKSFFNGENIYEGVDESLREGNSVLTNIVTLLAPSKDSGALGYICVPENEGDPVDGQTLGVLAELQLVIDELFIGSFARKGSFSIRNAFRNRGGKRIFLEYDIVEGGVLSPIYSLLVDLAIKESLDARADRRDPNAYFVIDEFKLLPNLKHMDDAVNFGRSLGVKFIIGVQNVSQIIENYGEDGAMNILSGFLNIMSFKVSDHATRKYLIELFGENRKRTAYLSVINSRGVVEALEKGNVVEDWDLQKMKKYECIVRLCSEDEEYSSPFIFRTLRFTK